MSDGQTLAVLLQQARPIPLDVRFECAPGELVALIGPSGAGKTTVLRAIAGLYSPMTCRVTVGASVWADNSKYINVAPQARRAGLVFQSYALFPHLSAIANVRSAMSHIAESERSARARALLERVHLAGLEDRKPGSLSGGQQQRVALARALARDPDVLLLDEPLSAVDRRTRRQLHAELLELRQTVRAPIVLVTHDIDEAAHLADRILVLDQGHVLQDGPARDVLSNPASQRVRDALDLPTP